MLVQGLVGLACMLQMLIPASALPTEQQPLRIYNSKSVQAVRSELKKAEIISTVIDDFLPSLTLSVSWTKDHAKLGNTIKPEHLQYQPTIMLHDETSSIDATKSDLTYVVTLTDPDAPSRDNPEWSEICHWIATNVSVAEKTLNILSPPESGLTDTPHKASTHSGPDDVIEYKPPGPPPKTGRHRYVFLVFAPKNGTTEPLHLSKPKERQHWGTGEERGGVRDWAEENELVPVAANFIYAKNKKQ